MAFHEILEFKHPIYLTGNILSENLPKYKEMVTNMSPSEFIYDLDSKDFINIIGSHPSDLILQYTDNISEQSTVSRNHSLFYLKTDKIHVLKIQLSKFFSQVQFDLPTDPDHRLTYSSYVDSYLAAFVASYLQGNKAFTLMSDLSKNDSFLVEKDLTWIVSSTLYEKHTSLDLLTLRDRANYWPTPNILDTRRTYIFIPFVKVADLSFQSIDEIDKLIESEKVRVAEDRIRETTIRPILEPILEKYELTIDPYAAQIVHKDEDVYVSEKRDIYVQNLERSINRCILEDAKKAGILYRLDPPNPNTQVSSGLLDYYRFYIEFDEK